MQHLNYMKLTRIFVFFFCLVLVGPIAQAQGILSSSDLKNVDIDQLSDSDIKAYYSKALESGLSEAQLYELAKNRGMSDQQVSKLRDRIALLGTAPAKPASQTEVGNVAATTERTYDSRQSQATMQATTFNSRIFGSELFAGTSTTFEPNLRIATPSNYMLGPDDELIINVFGYSEKTYRVKVNAEGNVYIENVGPIAVNGLSIEEAETKIRGKFSSTIYRAMASGATKMKLTLGNIRSMRITIIGEAKKPGTYTVSSLTTLFNALYLCGGPTDQGSFRKIQLIRGNKVLRTIDLYRFLAQGDRSDNILLQEQDVIRIPYYDARMVFSGYVKRPGIYEIGTGENFADLFAYAGKFADSAYRKSVTIYQIADEKLAIKTLPAEEFSVYKPQMTDSVVVGTAIMRYTNRVTIRGAVMRPGDYELQPGMDIGQLLEKAGGFREDAYLEGANILRRGEDLTAENVSFIPNKIKSGEEKITLKKDDEIVINSLSEIRGNYIVNIEGEVNQPGQFEWRKDLRAKDLVLLAGGLSEGALSAGEVHIEVSRRIKDGFKADFQQSKIIRINTTANLADSGVLLTLEPFDMVVVRPQPGYQPQKSIYINGPVMYPGRYFLEKGGERITDILIRAGRFKNFADSNSVFIRRYRTTEANSEERAALLAKISNIPTDSLMRSPALMSEIQKNYTSLSINVQKAFENPGGADDVIIEEGDLIMVSQNSSLVRVSGAVYYPTLVPYQENTNIKYYIKRTGNFTKAARKNQTFVIQPDGLARGVKKFLFFKSYPQVTPRSEIFVPSKSERAKQGWGTGEWVAVSSILATLTTLVITVINSK